MKKLLLILLPLIFLVSSCQEHVQEEKFAPGSVTVGIAANAEIDSIFNTLNGLNISIREMWGFTYLAPLPADSVNYLINLLNQKPYINTTSGWSATTSTVYYSSSANAIMITCPLFDMDTINQVDLLSILELQHMEDGHNGYKYMCLKVAEGTEKHWVEELKKYPFVTWSELDHVMNMDPL